jgi:hypothetical protein
MGRMSVVSLREDPFPFLIPGPIYNQVNSTQRGNGVSALSFKNPSSNQKELRDREFH